MLAIAPAGCAAGNEEADSEYQGPVYETVYAEVRTDFEEGLCEGELDRIDRKIESLEAMFQVQAPDEIIVRLADTFPVPLCPEGATGCFNPPYITTMTRSLDHELVHVVTSQLGIRKPFWQEGLAEALGGNPLVPGDAAVVDNVDVQRSGDVDYSTAGHFSRWLIETEGIERFVAAAETDDFVGTYGVPLSELQLRYQAEAPWWYPSSDRCTGDPFEFDGQRGRESILVSCDDRTGGRVAEPFPASTHLGVERVLWVSEPGVLEFSLQGGSGLFVHRCVDEILVEEPVLGSMRPEAPALYVESGVPTDVSLMPGEYRLAVYASPLADREETLLLVERKG